MNENNNFHVIIHTMQIRSDEALLDLDTISGKPYTKDIRFGKDALYTLNPNKISEKPLESLYDYKLAFKKIIEDLYISNYKLVRIDIAINSKEQFEKDYKLNKYVAELFALYYNAKNSYKSVGLLDLKKRSIKFSKRSLELEIYDKNLESDGRNPYNTRIEFRYKRIGKDKDEADLVKDLIEIMRRLPLYIEKLTKLKTDVLYKIWKDESSKDYKNTPVSNFSEFCRRYGNEIYNIQILKSLYAHVNSGKYSNWIKRYRHKNQMVCYSKTQVKAYLQSMITALHNYIDDGTYSTQYEKNN